MAYKFERLEVWKLALDYADVIYQIAEQLPRTEKYNLASQITRAANSIALNIAEGSTSQSDEEQARFIGYAGRDGRLSAPHQRRGYLKDLEPLEAYRASERLFAKLQAFRKVLTEGPAQAVRENLETYDTETPF